MSRNSYTPGPWKIRSLLAGSVGTDSQLVHICMNPIDPYSGMDEEDKANLLLIAAAPELLEACLRIQAQFRQAGIASVAGSLNPIEDNAAQIDAVILKALGQ